jgi:predicted O-methyltransferase YrrM
MRKNFLRALKALGYIAKNPYLLNHILNDEIFFKKAFLKEFPSYRTLKQVSLNQLLAADEIIIDPYGYLGGSSLPTDFALLQSLCRTRNVKDYFEIGTWRGESAANVAPYVSNCYTLNLSDDDLRKLGYKESYVLNHRHFSKDITNVTHLFGYSQHFDFEKLGKKFDLIFVDGDHHTDSVENDTRIVISLLKKTDSVVVWHDAFSDPGYPRYEVLLGIFRGLPESMRSRVYLVEHTLCAVYLPEGIQYDEFRENNIPERHFRVTIALKKGIGYN